MGACLCVRVSGGVFMSVYYGHKFCVPAGVCASARLCQCESSAVHCALSCESSAALEAASSKGISEVAQLK